ncbi:MAG TPA: hypothetical protein VK973_15150, partial [Arenicellales bacterium]|nr:hypothetical protein [Arenicellales bacterium]
LSGRDGATLIESTTDMQRQGELVLHRPVRSREFLELLNRISTQLSAGSLPFTAAVNPIPPDPGRARPDPAQSTRGVISRIRSRLGLAT